MSKPKINLTKDEAFTIADVLSSKIWLESDFVNYSNRCKTIADLLLNFEKYKIDGIELEITK